MGDTIVNMLPYALGIAISPVPVITVILTLFSGRARLNGVSFVAGWAIGIALPAIVVMMFALNREVQDDGPPSRIASILRVCVGVILVVIAVRNWMHRNKPDDAKRKPMLMKLVDAITPFRAWLVGFLFADVTNPKNMALTIAGCMEISAAHASSATTSLLLILFVLIASAGVSSPVVLYLLGGDASRQTIENWKQWLVVHKKTVMAVLFILFGLSFAYQGVAGLISN